MGTDHFRAFDYGLEKNFERYNRSTPPDYNLKNVHMKIVVYHVLYDGMVWEPNVKLLVRSLSESKVITHKIQSLTFNHDDFLWGKNSPKLIYKDIIDDLKCSEKL